MKKLTLLFSFLFLNFLYSQNIDEKQDVNYSLYTFNTIAVNPAYAGSRGALSVLGVHKTQRVNFSGEPSSQYLTLHSPINDKIGFGFSFENNEYNFLNQFGPLSGFIISDEIKDQTISGDLSLNLGNSRNSKFTLGLRVSAFKSISYAEDTKVDDGIQPNVGLGAYYRTPDFYLGISAPAILEKEVAFNGAQTPILDPVKETSDLYFIGGIILGRSDNFKIKPAILFKYDRDVIEGLEDSEFLTDLSCTAYIGDSFHIGGGYRLNEAFYGMAGFKITDALTIMYAFDADQADNTKEFSLGSHEILMRFDFKFRKNSYELISPRYF